MFKTFCSALSIIRVHIIQLSDKVFFGFFLKVRIDPLPNSPTAAFFFKLRGTGILQTDASQATQWHGSMTNELHILERSWTCGCHS